MCFVTIHPFEDGNGRIARAIADMSFARSEESPQRFYSLSAQTRLERNAYYDVLEATQKGDLDITPWIEWFLGSLDRAFDAPRKPFAALLRKGIFGRSIRRRRSMNVSVISSNRPLDGFEGNLTSSKWAAIEKCSPDTALRDIAGLVERGILTKAEGGRSTCYSPADD